MYAYRAKSVKWCNPSVISSLLLLILSCVGCQARLKSSVTFPSYREGYILFAMEKFVT